MGIKTTFTATSGNRAKVRLLIRDSRHPNYAFSVLWSRLPTMADTTEVAEAPIPLIDRADLALRAHRRALRT